MSSPSSHNIVFGHLSSPACCLEFLGPHQALDPILFSWDWLHQLFLTSLLPLSTSQTLTTTLHSRTPCIWVGLVIFPAPFASRVQAAVPRTTWPLGHLGLRQGFGIGQPCSPPKSTTSYISHSELSKSLPFILNPKITLQAHSLSAHHFPPNFKKIKANRHEGFQPPFPP